MEIVLNEKNAEIIEKIVKDSPLGDDFTYLMVNIAVGIGVEKIKADPKIIMEHLGLALDKQPPKKKSRSRVKKPVAPKVEDIPQGTTPGFDDE